MAKTAPKPKRRDQRHAVHDDYIWKEPRNDLEHIRECLWFQECLSRWEVEFLEGIEHYLQHRWTLSPRQYDKLNDITDKVKDYLRRKA